MGKPEASVDCWIQDSISLPATGNGHLSGKTIAVKDAISIKGHISSFGHPRWRATHKPSAETAPVITKLLAAGGSVAGLAKLDQLAYSLIGNVGEGSPPYNSMYPDRFTGGSSSGSAAAVCAGLVNIGIGTDTAGSIRVPSAACGLYGLRPTHNAIDSKGVLPLAPSFDVIGAMTSDPFLLRQVFEVIASNAAKDGPAPSSIREVRLPVDCMDGLSSEAAAAMEATAKALAKVLACRLAECTFSVFSNSGVADLFARIQGREIWQTHGEWVRANSESLAPDVRARLERAEKLSKSDEPEKRTDMRARDEYRARYARFLSHSEILVLPVMPNLPPSRDADSDELLKFRVEAFKFSAASSLTGCPELVIPVTHSPSSKRFGIGILGSSGSDYTLLCIPQLLVPEGGRIYV